MNEIYWITRLDSVVEWLGGLQAAGTAAGIICLIVYLVWKYAAAASYNLESSEYKENQHFFNRFKWIGAITLSVGLLFGIAKSFVPTTKEACAIYVGGSVIDYVQGNDTIKALPDKMVNFANDYLNQIMEKNKQKTTTSD